MRNSAVVAAARLQSDARYRKRKRLTFANNKNNLCQQKSLHLQRIVCKKREFEDSNGLIYISVGDDAQGQEGTSGVGGEPDQRRQGEVQGLQAPVPVPAVLCMCSFCEIGLLTKHF